ncbi:MULTISPECIES: ABC transporter ATP-binding protein [unclassified Chelatococcus]|uniref:dipeptide ABC transporter ATP-binding protein n=1 Tax=unclassified Chelatococcus TaxID=2638111 RepID=UPI0002F78D8C|nr:MULTISPECIES: ABC transporter ATP-binding protein [unclassified Chelatococcus]ALA18597.1 ABC transporter ATP-binding protein [Chelatococcus sp. CO-6]
MSGTPLLSIRDLSVSYREKDDWSRVVHGVSLDVHRGEVVALVGESGSGKTTTAQSVIGLLPGNGRIDQGEIRLDGTDISRWPSRRLDAIRGARISLIPQDPGSALNPIRTIGAQVGEILKIHGWRDKKAIASRVVELLARVGLTEPELRARQYPHELSGGMKQRVLIAIAVALQPELIVADEPTSGLDVTVQRRILDLIDELRLEFGTSVLLVTHDLGVAADRAGRLVVMQGGRIQEEGPTAALIAAPRSAYARRLLADAPSLDMTVRRQPRPEPIRERDEADDFAVIVEDLTHDFPLADGGTFRAVDGISFRLRRGTTHALVGESGSGKTTTIRSIVGFEKPTAGRILVDGTDIAALHRADLRRFRRKIQLVYQNPFASLDPRQNVFEIIEEPLLNFDKRKKDERRRSVESLLDRVGLSRTLLGRAPHALSGGQRQRVAIARALVLEPQVLVLDEAVSALDVTVQAQVLKLLDELQRDLGLTYLFVSHDLAVVRQIADSVSVLHRGRQVESGPVERIFHAPTSSYTRDLLAAIPGRTGVERARTLSPGSDR